MSPAGNAFVACGRLCNSEVNRCELKVTGQKALTAKSSEWALEANLDASHCKVALTANRNSVHVALRSEKYEM
jgi:hypothetical protein